MKSVYRGFAKMMVLVCIALQCIAMTPHHHHAASLAFCIDCEHLAEADGCGDSEHDTFPDGERPLACPTHEMVLTLPETVLFKAHISCVEHHLHGHMHCPHCICLPCNNHTAALLDDCSAVRTIAELAREFVPQRCAVQIQTAIPPRAPDFC